MVICIEAKQHRGSVEKRFDLKKNCVNHLLHFRGKSPFISSLSQMFFIIDALENFAIFTRKQLCCVVYF